jgi:tripartite-type tricarboxylate transporter receptor subunit TctC
MMASAAAVLAMGRAARASYATRPITIIVPYAAGGAGDSVLRVVAESLEKRLGQPIVIDARPGGGGTVGARAVATAAPDGHTLLLGAANNFVINQFMFPKTSLDPFTELDFVVRVADVPSVLYASNAVPGTTLSEFIAYAKANPGKLSYASPSVGTTPHLAVELLKQRTGIELVHVPYRGAPPAMQALLANEVQLYLAGWGVGRGNVEAGRIKAIAVASRERLAGVPVPTVIESGVPDFVASNWWGLAAPRGTPRAVIGEIHQAFAATLAEPVMAEKLTTLGFLPSGQGPEPFLSDAKIEARVWQETVARGKLAVDQ